MRNYYDTLSEAIEDLRKYGFTEDFNLCSIGLENKSKKYTCPAGDLAVLKFYRFEGLTNPDDNAVLYAIETAGGDKGLLVDAYGAYSGEIPTEMLQKLKMH